MALVYPEHLSRSRGRRHNQAEVYYQNGTVETVSHGHRGRSHRRGRSHHRHRHDSSDESLVTISHVPVMTTRRGKEKRSSAALAAAAGDFVANQLVPQLQQGSDRPVSLYMNYGTMVMQDDMVGRSGSNAVIYNSPGGTMILNPAPPPQPSANNVYATTNNGNNSNGAVTYDGSDATCQLGCCDLTVADRTAHYRTPANGIATVGPSLCLRCRQPRYVSALGYCVDCEAFQAFGSVDGSGIRRNGAVHYISADRRLLGY